MKGVATALLAMAFCASTAMAHSGGLDKCGGHNDKKRGGYHIHNMQKFCACYPDAPECKQDAKKKPNER